MFSRGRIYRYWRGSDERVDKRNPYLVHQFESKLQPGKKMTSPVFTASELDLLSQIFDSTLPMEVSQNAVRENQLLIKKAQKYKWMNFSHIFRLFKTFFSTLSLEFQQRWQMKTIIKRPKSKILLKQI